ncbi:hypothetical protein [Desulfovirgula thermocuniculi]|uniref:hypothetical protein n=1 Tax=Desulfovirgula thermocuniculi TaxID=348842 RepID=UPI000404688F|nr:hypothetical protein [Desulfovirgula thermocuniculi]
MKLKIPIEEVREGDRINGKEVVDILHRFTGYVRLTLRGGSVVDGFRKRDFIEIERAERKRRAVE